MSGFHWPNSPQRLKAFIVVYGYWFAEMVNLWIINSNKFPWLNGTKAKIKMLNAKNVNAKYFFRENLFFIIKNKTTGATKAAWGLMRVPTAKAIADIK